MAQQTRLETMLPYFERWMQRFPDVGALAHADQQDVLVLWEGLGYYQRARNLHAAAEVIVRQYGGRIPDTYEELLTLPGIGPYTAGAIASLAFGRDEPAVDGNAIRVLSRLLDIDFDPQSSAGKRAFQAAARDLLPPGQASAFNQALMDLGARVCIPRNPQCDLCPLSADCQAYQLNIQELRPVRKFAAPLPIRYIVSLVLRYGTQVMLRQRSEQGLLGGLWEFPNLELSLKDESALPQAVKAEWGLSIDSFEEMESIRHTYSHFHAQVRVFVAQLPLSLAERGGVPNLQWTQSTALADLPMGKIDRAIAKRFQADVG